jgi:RHS repeat-associated protein
VYISDKNGDGFIQVEEDDMGGSPGYSEIIQENHYYPFGLNMTGPWDAPQWEPGNAYQYNGKEWNEDLGLNLYDYGARWYDAAVGRFTGVDPMADVPHSVGMTPYHFVANNPIRNIDPDGMDWYQNENGDQIWLNNRDATHTDDDGVEWSNIGEELLFFGGKNLLYYTQTEDEDGNLSLNMEVFDAVSGARDSEGDFDYSDSRQAQKNAGPIPEGDYGINPQEIQTQTWFDKTFTNRWPGGEGAWGKNRVWINPYSVEVTDPETGDKVERTGMTIHGGNTPGSIGCIDCYQNAPAFFNSLSISKQTNVRLRVRYPSSLKKKKKK